MAVPDQAVPPVRQLQVLHAGQERLGFQLDRLREQPPSAGAQDIRQGIVDLVRLTKADNIGRRRSWRIAPFERFWQARHPPRYAAFITPSSPSFRHSSRAQESH